MTLTQAALTEIRPEFVQFAPQRVEMQFGVIYVSMECETALHLCACGCGEEIVTPFHRPDDWRLSVTAQGDDKRVTLGPSIGNQNFPCRSHYYIRDNRVEWC